MTFVVPEGRTISLSNGKLVLRYRSQGQAEDGQVSFRRAKNDPLPAPAIPIEIFTRFKHTKGKEVEMEIVLPATPALSGIREISLTFGKSRKPRPVDLSITAFGFTPFDCALEAVR